jgi:hypothetical protein
MRDFAAEWAQVDAAEADLKQVIDRLVDMVLNDEIIGSGKAALALEYAGLVTARSIAAALGRTEITWQPVRLVYLLGTLGPPRDSEIIQELERLAEEDPHEDVREHAQLILDDLARMDLYEEEAELW